MSEAEDLKETIALIRDKADNYLMGIKAMPGVNPKIHLQGMIAGLSEIRKMAIDVVGKA